MAGEARTPLDGVTVASWQVGTPECDFRGWEGREGGLGFLPLGEHAGGWAGVGAQPHRPGRPRLTKAPEDGHSAPAWVASFR